MHRDFCPQCRKMVEPKVPDALPNATIGNRLGTLDKTTYTRRYHQIEKRLESLIEEAWVHKEVRRLLKRLRRHRHELFTFLLEPEVPFENNLAERMIRQAVIMRKDSYSNRSQRGAGHKPFS